MNSVCIVYLHTAIAFNLYLTIWFKTQLFYYTRVNTGSVSARVPHGFQCFESLG